MTGLQVRVAAVTRALLDASAAVSLVALWRAGTSTPFIELAFVAVAARAFLRSEGRSTALRSTIVTVVGGAIVIHLHGEGRVPAAEVGTVPLLAALTYAFAAFAAWQSRVERSVSRDRERLARLIDALPLATIAFDAQARVVTWNRAAEALFGWSAEEAFGQRNPIVPPDEKAGSDELHARILRGETLKGVEVERRAANGAVLELSVYSAPIDVVAGPCEGFLVLYDDIDERRRAERDRDEAQTRYRDLVEALPLVTYIDRVDDHATNEYTSPQAVALLGWDPTDWISNPTFFETLLHPDDRERVMAQVAHANASLDPFESEYRLRHSSGDHVWVRDHSAIVESPGGERFARGFLLDITKQRVLEEQLLQAQKMDALGQFAGGIAHDFNNLLTAISGYAELAEGSARRDAALMRCLDGIRIAAGEAAGMDETTRLRAFEPFFTTKAEGEGTGLGLAVAYGVVDSLGGSLSIISAPGEGTTVEALLPAARDEAPTPGEPRRSHARSHGSGRVLVVEDRQVVRELARDVLEAEGFDVVAAAGGDEALEIAARAGCFDLVLTDVVMPRMNGLELASSLRARFEGLPVIYMSGYTDDVLAASALAEPTTAFLRKPFANAELVEKVRELLDAVSAAPTASTQPALRR